jgi:hypothetical protein
MPTDQECGIGLLVPQYQVYGSIHSLESRSVEQSLGELRRESSRQH